MTADHKGSHLIESSATLDNFSRQKLSKHCQQLQQAYSALLHEHAQLKQSFTAQIMQCQALHDELKRIEILTDKRVAELERIYTDAKKTLQEEAAAWRANNEDEFCRLIASTTRHISALQEKFERTTKRESFASHQLVEITEERNKLRAQVAQLKAALLQIKERAPV
jgi:hypothetical protein